MAASSSTAASQGWAAIGERGSLWALRFGVWCYRTLGRRLAIALAHAVAAYFFLTDRRGRRASAAYLQRLYATPAGRAAMRGAPGSWQSFLQYRAFALSLVDRLDIFVGRTEDFAFETHGIELFDHYRDQGRGVLVLGAHLGSFDALRLLADRAGYSVNALMFTAHAERINTIFRELSPEADARVIQADPASIHSVFEIRECVRRGELVAILGDRVEPGDRRRTSRVSFLGGIAELPQAPFLLANLLRCPVLLMLALRTGPRRYEVFTEILADRVELPRCGRDAAVEKLLASYASRLEHYCGNAPLQWFNFYDYWGDATN